MRKKGRTGSRRRLRRLAIAAIVLFVLGGVGTALAWRFLRASPGERAEHFRGLGVARLGQRQFGEAEGFLRRALEEDDENALTHVLLAQSLFGQDREDDAIAALQRALRLDPADGPANRRLAKWHFARGEYDESIALTTRAMEAPGDDAGALYVRAGAHLANGQPREALADLRALVLAAPENQEVCLRAADLAALVAAATWDVQLDAAADRLLERAEHRGGKGRSDGLVRAAVLLRRGLHGSARVALEDAPEGEARTLLEAEALLAQGSQVAAEQRLRAALESAPSAALHAALVRHLTRTERLETATVALGAAVRAFPEDGAIALTGEAVASARYRGRNPDDLLVAVLAPRSGPANPLEPSLRAALATRARDPGALRIRVGLTGPVLIATPVDTEGYAEWLAAFDSDLDALLTGDPTDAVALVWKAAVQVRNGDASAAVLLCDRALAARPDLRPALLVRAVAHLQTEAYELAEADVRAAVATGRLLPAAEALLTRALHGQGLYAAALAQGRRALGRAPADLHLAAAVRAILEDTALPEAATSAPDNREATLLQARLLLARGDVAGAGRLAETLLDGDQPDAARVVLGAAWDSVAARLAAEETATPDDPEIPLKRADALLRAGRAQQAGDVLEKAAERRPADARAGLALARLRAREGRREESLERLRALLELDPASGEIALERARVLAAGGRSREAVSALLAILEGAAGFPDKLQAALWALAISDDLSATAERVQAWVAVESANEEHALDLSVLRGHLCVARDDAAGAEQIAATLMARNPDEPSVQFLVALVAAGRQELERVEALAVAVLERVPTHVPARRLLARVRLERGRRAFTQGDVEAARAHWLSAVGVADADLPVAILLGHSFAGDDDETAARALYRQLNAAHPESPLAPLLLAYRAQARRQPGVALPNFREAYARLPGHAACLVGLIEVTLACGDGQGALVIAREAAARRDPDGVAHYVLGKTLAHEGDSEQALDAYRVSLSRHRGNWEALAGLVDLLVASGRKDEARSAIEASRAAAAVPRGWGLSLARILEHAGDRDAALTELRGEVRRSGSYASRIALGRVLARSGDLVGAREAFEEAIRAVPQAQDAYFELVRIYYQMGEMDAAVERFSQAVERGEDVAAASCVLGLIAEQRGDDTAAERHYRKALTNRADIAIASNNLAWLLGVRMQRLDEALPLARRAREIAPDSPDIADTLGWLLHLSGDSLAALVELDHAVRLAPERAAFHHRRGEILLAASRSGEALKAFERAQVLDAEYASENGLPDRIGELRSALDK